MAQRGTGFMAIWSDVAPADLGLYHDWLLKEHFPERVGIAGFLTARVFGRAVDGGQQFFILYETQAPQVLASPAYIERLNNPTPLSQTIMPRLKNFVRGAGRIIQSRGQCGGAAVKVLRFEKSQTLLADPAQRAALFDQLYAMDRVLAVHLFEVDEAATTIPTAEKKLRTSAEAIYRQLLMIEAVDAQALAAVAEVVSAALAPLGEAEHPFEQSYQFIAELQRRSLA